MQQHAWWVALAVGSGLLITPATGDLVIDVDPGTPGIQTGLSVLSGASVTLVTYFDPTTSGPVPFNAFGVNLEWTPLGSASALPTTPPLSGFIAAGSPAAIDMISGGGPVPVGGPLATAILPPSVGLFALGGVGLADATAGFWGFGGPVPVPVDLFGVTFTIVGAPGETVIFTPSGILFPGTGSAPGVGPLFSGGDPLQLSPSGGPTFVTPTFSSVITIVPEPGVLMYLLLGSAFLIRARSRVTA